jgi:DNA excision repair protein ERCC-4
MNNNKIYTKCKVCGEEFNYFAELQKHLRYYHKLSCKTYFETYWKRIDRFDGKKIEYKSFDQYITCDFVDKKNYKNWLKTLSKEECSDYFKSKLTQYCSLKNLDVAPSQVECQSINCLLPVSTMEVFSGMCYNNLCQKVGLHSRFNYQIPEEIPFTPIPQIIVDSREQKPFQFEGHTLIESKLEYGDYSLHPNNKLAIERKSLSDLYGTLSGGRERFEREIQKAKKLEGYIVVVVESTLNNMMYQKQKFGKASGEFIAHNMRQLLRKYDNLQFVFCDDRKDAKIKTLHILAMNEEACKFDLQYYFDTIWPL